MLMFLCEMATSVVSVPKYIMLISTTIIQLLHCNYLFFIKLVCKQYASFNILIFYIAKKDFPEYGLL